MPGSSEPGIDRLISLRSILLGCIQGILGRDVVLGFASDGGTADLAADSLREFVNEFHDTGILIRSGLFLDVVLDLLYEFVGRFTGTLNESNGSLYYDASYTLRVRCARYGTL